ncbi:MAG: YibE/F family protein, partial [Cetobacterium sp.]
MKKILFFIMMIFSINIFSEEIDFGNYKVEDEYIKGKVLYLENVLKSGYTEDDGIKEIEEYRVKILEGEDKDKEIIVQAPIYLEKAYNIFIKKNQNIVLYKEITEENENIYYVVDVDKRNSLLAIVLIFIILTVAIARLKGIKAIISLVIVVGIIYNIFLPMIAQGYSPIIISTLCALLCSVITIFITTGFTQKGVVAVLGAVAGV